MSSLQLSAKKHAKASFIQVSGTNLINQDGSNYFIIGTNLGNWLNPEAYMFGFGQAGQCEWQINAMLSELIGTDETADFWKAFKDNYITRRDIEFIAATGANTIRLPFNYKLFTDEDYMGLSSKQDGFTRIDSVITWCRENGLHVILDMHDCPGGQTGTNIDNSYGYPWLFESERSQQLFCKIWQDIARRYKKEPVVLGYELMNEPIAPFFKNVKSLNAKMEPLCRRAVKAIREVDSRHIILLGGTQWNTNFSVYSDWSFDSQLMFTCHRYGGQTPENTLKSFIEFRDKTGLPMYMGETGHTPLEWQSELSRLMRKNNIGYTFWPYKKIGGQAMMSVGKPSEWDSTVVKFSKQMHPDFFTIEKESPDRNAVRRALKEFIRNCRMENCKPLADYIRSIGLKCEDTPKN
jgi:hypothetical protein